MDRRAHNAVVTLSRFPAVRKSPPGTSVQLAVDEIAGLCKAAKEIFLSQPMLLELEAPLKICGEQHNTYPNMSVMWPISLLVLILGSIHGQYYDLLRLFGLTGFPPQSTYLFLGNYVDYGQQSLETVCLLLAYKIKYPEKVYLLRGNHECGSISRIYGFYHECKLLSSSNYNYCFLISCFKTHTSCR